MRGVNETTQVHPPGDGAAEARSRRDTRARIQQVAVELFTEHGYDATSLREIAERLDVTKAALYYHFKSKEDIVASLVEDYFGQIDALIAWAREQPPSDEVRGEILRRYVRIVAEQDRVLRMLHQNQAAVHTMAVAKRRGELFKERMHSLVDLLAGPGATLEERLRATMTIGGASIGWTFYGGQAVDREELGALITSLACDFARLPRPTAPAGPPGS